MSPERSRPGLLPPLAFAALAVLALVPAVQAQGCSEPGHNVQCSELGTVRMESVRQITGSPIQVTSQVTLNSNFQNYGARWFLFSVRNVTADGANPVSVKVDGFTADGTPVVTNKMEEKPYETDFWVAVEDVPVGKTIQINMTVGAADAGAFQLETLVMAFDRGYAAITDSGGNQASLFSFTLLGVKSPTASLGATPLSHAVNVPSVGVPAALGVLGLAVVAGRAAGRRRA